MLLRRSDVPAYLRQSEFFLSLDRDDEDCFEVPVDCYKANLADIFLKELPVVFQTIRFWGLTEMPLELFQFLHTLSDLAWIECHKICVDYPQYQEYFGKIDRLRTTSPPKKIPMAIQLQFGLQVLQYLHKESGCELSSAAILPAVELDDVSSLQYIHRCGCRWHADTIVICIKSCSYACFEYALANGCPTNGSHMRTAASFGHVGFMQRLLSNVHFKTFGVAAAAAANGHLDCLKYAHENGFPWNAATCSAAVEAGHLECLQYALEQGCPYHSFIMDIAASNGHLACLVYLHQHGIHPWDAITCAEAATGGHLQCLKYLHRQGCAWDVNTVKQAMMEGHWDCVRYALRHNCPCNGMMLMMCALYCLDGLWGLVGAKATL